MQQFHPLIQAWLKQRFTSSTGIQKLAWPVIADGEHVLITAPTGSGKTLTAFLWALQRLLFEPREQIQTRVLYISPLKALNNDIQRNLQQPLSELRALAEQRGIALPTITVLTRSGDTPAYQRQRMQRHPPDILITTPESLNLMLTARGNQNLLSHIHTVILDEIHALVDSQRGTHLMSAVERLVPLSGEFQRIALSATVNPLAEVAEFVGGYRLLEAPTGPRYQARDLKVLKAADSKVYQLHIKAIPEAIEIEQPDGFWLPLVEQFVDIIEGNQATLFFTNSRRLCEKLTLLINQQAGQRLAYSHHGSLAKELRLDVEQQLKDGRLKAIVATSSLELGIDIGELDEVVLIQAPSAVASALQRMGRAGHGVGEISRARLFPTSSEDYLNAAVLAQGVQNRRLETTHYLRNPLDLLAQIIISMTAITEMDIDVLYAQVRCCSAYQHLPRQHFDLVLQMLAGRYSQTRIRELQARVELDLIGNTVAAKKSALMSLYMTGGTIPNRGYYKIKTLADNALVGELDEEFVWEASVGQTFSLGTQHWRIENITHNDVLVTPGSASAATPPFWKAEQIQHSFDYACLVGEFLQYADTSLAQNDSLQLLQSLQHDYCLDLAAAQDLLDYLQRQRAFCQHGLPHRYRLLAEHISAGPGGSAGEQLVLHTRWGGKVNRPIGLALEAAWQQRWSCKPKIYVDNQCIVVQLTEASTATQILNLLSPVNFESLLRQRLEGSGFFAGRFREAAGRALLLNKGKFNQRLPLWMSRLQAQKIMDAVQHYQDFPLLLETWRSCLQDEFDIKASLQVLAELESGEISWVESFSNTPSPFASSIAWGQINQYMYEADSNSAQHQSQLREDLVKQVANDKSLRPKIPQAIHRSFALKQRRCLAGYVPQDENDLLAWLRDLWLIPAVQWQALLEAMAADEILVKPTNRMRRLCLTLSLAGQDYFVHAEMLTSVQLCIDEGDDETKGGLSHLQLLQNFMRYQGVVDLATAASVLPFDEDYLSGLFQQAIDASDMVVGQLLADTEDVFFCDFNNYQQLLRLRRKQAQQQVQSRPLGQLAYFLAQIQGMGDTKALSGEAAVTRVFDCLESLRQLPQPVALWEQDLLPCRIANYDSSWLDSLMQEGELGWRGHSGAKLSFDFCDELRAVKPKLEGLAAQIAELLEQPDARYDFSQLRNKLSQQDSVLSSSKLVAALWEAVWAGAVSNLQFTALRKGLLWQFKLPELDQGSRRRSSLRGYSKALSPYEGYWYGLSAPSSVDAIEQLEANKNRVRTLMLRYGVVCKVLLRREHKDFSWRELLPSLRLMELSGELTCGQFFKGLPGLQFIGNQGLRLFSKSWQDRSYWLSACDPVSLCGVDISGKQDLPRRIGSNFVSYCGSELLLKTTLEGAQLQFLVAEDDPRLLEALAPLHHLLYRAINNKQRIVVKKINGVSARKSPYLALLRQRFDVALEPQQVLLQKQYY